MQEWLYEDKENWEDGPWKSEPDKVQWVDEETGLDCLIVRGPVGALCGYVGVDESHPLFEVNYSQTSPALEKALKARMEQPIGENPSFRVLLACLGGDLEACPDAVFRVHGGLTYSDFCVGKVCHEPEPGRPEKVWWFGFDCGHCDDYMPNFPYSFRHGCYKDIEYVKNECKNLAKQLALLRQ